MNKRLLLALYDRSGLGAYMPVDYKGHELAVEEHMEKFAELIVRECSRICGSQADQRNILKHFGFPVESNVRVPAPEPHWSVTSQYTRDYNIPKQS